MFGSNRTTRRGRRRRALWAFLALSIVVALGVAAAIAYNTFSRMMGAITENASRGPVRDLYDRANVEISACEHALRAVPGEHTLGAALDRIRSAGLMVPRITADLAAVQSPDRADARACLPAVGAFDRRAAAMKTDLVPAAVLRAGAAAPAQADLEAALDVLRERLKELESTLSVAAGPR